MKNCAPGRPFWPSSRRKPANCSTCRPTRRWHDGWRTRVPIRAACLDLALSRLPRPDNRFALGLDRPLYYSVHSAAAKLAPEGVAVVHVMKYLGTDTNASSQAIEQELESFLDQIQPGWKEHVDGEAISFRE